MKQKILIVGLPRSGTTIISNTINSLENAFCFIEPHWEKELKGSVNFNDKKLKWIFGLKYYPNDSLPLDHTITKILKKYDIVGFKETFRSNVFKSFKKNFPNENLLYKYKAVGYKIIPIIRNPLNVWNSNKSFVSNEISLKDKLSLFMQNYCDFIKFMNPEKPIIFENFIDNPSKALQEFGFSAPEKIQLRKLRMGDDKARISTKIDYTPRPILYTKEEESIIQKSEAMKKYQLFYGKNN